MGKPKVEKHYQFAPEVDDLIINLAERLELPQTRIVQYLIIDYALSLEKTLSGVSIPESKVLNHLKKEILSVPLKNGGLPA